MVENGIRKREMNIKNVRKVSDNEYVLDYEHKILGWIPYTVLLDSEEDISKSIAKEIEKNHKSAKLDIDIIAGSSKYEANEQLNGRIAAFEKKYTQREIASWPTKRNEANKVLAGETSVLLENEAKIENETVQDIARKIIEKNDSYLATMHAASHIRKKINSLFDSSKSEKDINAIKKEFANLVKVHFGDDENA